LALHGIVFIWGFTAILGKLIDLPSEQLVWWRMGIAWIGLWVIGQFLHAKIESKKVRWKAWGIGILVALHWYFFFEAAKVSNVTISLLGLSATAFFTSFFEPWVLKRNIDWKEVGLGVVTLIGISIAFPFDRSGNLGLGFFYSLLAALFGCSFSTLNSTLLKESTAAGISKHEFLGGFVALTFLLLFQNNHAQIFTLPSWDNLKYLLLLGLICTSFAFLASVYLMKFVSPFTINLTVNLEPVYGILLAFWIFNEQELFSPKFIIGALVVFIAVFANALLKKMKS
jgi:drug/metabolite transporter (DMT)-like permease